MFFQEPDSFVRCSILSGSRSPLKKGDRNYGPRSVKKEYVRVNLICREALYPIFFDDYTLLLVETWGVGVFEMSLAERITGQTQKWVNTPVPF